MSVLTFLQEKELSLMPFNPVNSSVFKGHLFHARENPIHLAGSQESFLTRNTAI
jgi:hypothetical protein